MVILFGRRVAIWIFIAAVAANLATSTPAWVSVGIGLGNSLEALAVSWIFQRLMRASQGSYLHKHTIAFLVSGPLGSLISPTLGVLLLSVNAEMRGTILGDAWLTWWIGDLVGVWIVAPLLLNLERHKEVELIEDDQVNGQKGHAFLLIVCSTILFYGLRFSQRPEFLFMTFPMVYFSSRLWPRWPAQASVGLISILFILCTKYGFGPFQDSTLNANFVQAQAFLAGLAVAAMILSDFNGRVVMRTPGIVLLVGWSFGLIIFTVSNQHEIKQNQRRFENLVDLATQKLKAQERITEGLLNSGVALFLASDDVTARDWREFTDVLAGSRTDGGIFGLGVAVKVPRNERSRFERSMRHLHGREIHIHDYNGSIHERDVAYVIKFIEPLESVSAVLGVDVSSNSSRLRALQRSDQSREMVFSESFLIVNNENLGPALVAVKSIPAKNASSSEFVGDGWIFAPIVIKDFFEQSLREFKGTLAPQLTWQEPGGLNAPISLLGSDSRPTLDAYAKSSITLGSRKFELEWRPGPSYRESRSRAFVWLAITSALVALMFASSIANQQLLNVRANEIAEERTRRLRTMMVAGEVLNESQSQEDLFAHVLRILRLDLGWDVAICWWWNSDQRMLEPISHSFDERLSAEKLSSLWSKSLPLIESGNVGRTFAESGPLWSERLSEADGKHEFGLGNMGFRSSVTFPIRLNQRVLAVVELLSYQQKALELELLVTLYDVGLRTGERLEHIRVEADSEIQKKKLVEISKMSALGEMSGGIAHEINNPLTVIAGRAQQIRRLLEAETPPKEKIMKAVENIQSTVDRVSKIISGLRAFARRSETDEMQVVQVSNLVRGAIELGRDRFKGANIEIRAVNLLDGSVSVREAEILQVLLNLLNNAFDAVLGQSDAWVEISVERHSDLIEVNVLDSGRGISEAVVQKMMQPFFTTKPVGKGTGLGLSISFGIAQAHGGSLRYSLKNGHTCFTLTLPEHVVDQHEIKAA